MGQDRKSLRASAAGAVWWFLLLSASIAVTTLATDIWHWTAGHWGVVVASTISVAALAMLSLIASVLVGRVTLPGTSAVYPLAYVARMVPCWLRMARCRRGPAWTGSEQEFLTADSSRGVGDQSDFGVGWRDPDDSSGYRVTWLHETREVVIVRSRDGVTELVTTIDTEFEVTRRLEGYGYAMVMPNSLKWARRRLRGIAVPLPPRAKSYQRLWDAPRQPWPSPPPPSVGRKAGSYFFSTSSDAWSVEVSYVAGRRPLYHYVDGSPTGFSWGYNGSGPTDLARSLLADRLGYVPHQTVYFQFRNEVIAKLACDDASMDFAIVDAWIDANGALFAVNPRAEPFDPFAAGGK